VMGLSHRSSRGAALRLWLRAPASLPADHTNRQIKSLLLHKSTATKPFSKLKGDSYQAYDELPVEVRRALQEALLDWCSLRARDWHLRLLREQRLRPAQASSFLVQTILRHDHDEVAAFAKTWPKGPEVYPHLAAEATLQRYVGTEGIPAAEPIVFTATAKRFRVAARPFKSRAKRKAGHRARR
ncbi:DUF6525 family protein, partial [Falsiroseomonas sp.]|uniref:DUF6525 family protein n=1 Tax=Falsiroseomonas sp. TaxID=2870721 RepID=UPI00271CAA05